MSNNPYRQHNDLPPPYPGSLSNTLRVPTPNRASSEYSNSTYREDEEGDSAIPIEDRRSMEMETRELPPGWRREFDANTKHIFYVDTKAKPPRSIWIHPYDDPEYLASLPEDSPIRQHHLDQASGSGESSHSPRKLEKKSQPNPPAGGGEEKRSFGRKLKDKVTGKTHEQRVQERKEQAARERAEYEKYLKRRQAMIDAQRNGTYQPAYAAPMGGYPGRYGAYGGYGGGGYGYGGYGGGYGYNRGGMGGMGGMGMGGAGLGLGAGLLGGLLIGDMMF